MMYVQQYGKIYIYWIKLLTIFFWRYSTGKKHVMMTIQRNWYTTFLYCFLFLIKINLTVLQKDWMFVIYKYCKNWIWMYSTLSKVYWLTSRSTFENILYCQKKLKFGKLLPLRCFSIPKRLWPDHIQYEIKNMPKFQSLLWSLSTVFATLFHSKQGSDNLTFSGS